MIKPLVPKDFRKIAVSAVDGSASIATAYYNAASKKLYFSLTDHANETVHCFGPVDRKAFISFQHLVDDVAEMRSINFLD